MPKLVLVLVLSILLTIAPKLAMSSPLHRDQDSHDDCFRANRPDVAMEAMMELIRRDIHAAYDRYFDAPKNDDLRTGEVWVRGVGGWGPGISLETEFYLRFDRIWTAHSD